MLVAILLSVGIAVTVAVFVWKEGADDADWSAEFYDHHPRPLLTVIVTERPHLYDWNSDDIFIDLREV